MNSEKGGCGVKYPPGVGLMQFPFTAWLTTTDANNTGFSNAEHNAVLVLGAGLLVLVGVFTYLSLQLFKLLFQELESLRISVGIYQ